MLTRIKYTGATPGADSNDYTLFTTVDGQMAANFFPINNVKRFVLALVHNAQIVLTWSKSEDRGVTWLQLGTETITGVSNAETMRDFLVEPYADWRLVLTNGGSAQTTFAIDMIFTTQRNIAV